MSNDTVKAPHFDNTTRLSRADVTKTERLPHAEWLQPTPSGTVASETLRAIFDKVGVTDEAGALVALHTAAFGVPMDRDALLDIAALAIVCAQLAGR